MSEIELTLTVPELAVAVLPDTLPIVGAVLSILLTFTVPTVFVFTLSVSLAYTVPFDVSVCVLVLSHFSPSLLVCNVYPVTLVPTVTVTFPFVQLFVLFVNVKFPAGISCVSSFTVPTVVFPTLSLTSTFIVYFVVWVNPSNV